MFAFSLRRRWPRLWHTLNIEIWRSAPPRPDLREWSSRQGLGIVDGWLIDALQQTIDHWDLTPDSPDARLEENAKWFYYVPTEQMPEFNPTFDKPYPTYSAPGGQNHLNRSIQTATTREEQLQIVKSVELESLDAFRRRIERQFKRQLADYVSLARSTDIYDSKPQLVTHSEWAASALGGVPIAKISRAQEWEKILRKGDPESTVGKAVARFADRIGLTLRRQCGQEHHCSTLGITLGTRNNKNMQSSAIKQQQKCVISD
jgi:hypothetical protein